MKKLKVLHRDIEEYSPLYRRGNNGGVVPIFRNPLPALHPMADAREKQRALTAAKLEKMFSKPLIGVLDGHRDAVRVLARPHLRVDDIFSGCCDGEIRHWQVSEQRCLHSIRAHTGFVRGLSLNFDDTFLLSCGDDGVVKRWDIEKLKNIASMDKPQEIDNLGWGDHSGNLVQLIESDISNLTKVIEPVGHWKGGGPLTSVDTHWTRPMFLTTGESIDFWDLERSTPVQSMDWNDDKDGIVSGRLNPADPNLIVASGADNAIAIYDLRSGDKVQAVLMNMRTNSLAWNPMGPMRFIGANEDSNIYQFDLRKMEEACRVHKDFQNAVLDVAFSPTGQEFVGASFDRTIRIFEIHGTRSREIYHGQRMQMALSCAYSPDGRFVYSGSADFCVRIWKAKAWEKLGPKYYGERQAIAYREALKEKYSQDSDVRRILRHRHVPQLIKSLKDRNLTKQTARRRRLENAIAHSKNMVKTPEKKKGIRKVLHDTPTSL